MRAFTSLIVAAFAAASASAAPDSIEYAPFSVVREDGNIQIRDYDAYIVAEVDVTAASNREAASRGFGPLARYIFGGNTARTGIDMTSPVTTAPKSQQIAMTAPVSAQPADNGNGDTFTVQFMMPSEWTMDTLPTPNDPRVRLVEQAPRRMIAYRYTGRDNSERRSEAETALREFADVNGLTIVGPAEWAGYDDPRTPTAQKRWDFMLPVAGN